MLSLSLLPLISAFGPFFQFMNTFFIFQGDDPPYLSVGTEVSAKYKGAFCEAKIKKVVRLVKCRVTFKQGLGTSTVTDDQIKGNLRVGALVEAKHSDKKDFLEATINKIKTAVSTQLFSTMGI